MKNLLFALTAVTMIGLASCGSSCDAEDIAASATTLSEAASAYAQDSSKCDDYKTALEDYISDFDGCEGVTDEIIAGYQAIVDDLECN